MTSQIGGDFMADTITLVFNILLIAFIVFGMLWGIIRGLKKTISRGLFLLVISIITLFVTIPLVKLLLGIPITVETNSNGEITTTTCTIVEYLSELLKSLLGEEFVGKYPDFASSLASIPLILINAFAYLIVFWLLKILTTPINAIINSIIFRKKKQKEVLGFSANNDEYPNSDKSIEPLMDIYNNSQKDTSNQGMFIKKDDEIAKDAPSARAKRLAKTQSINVTDIEKPKTKRQLRKEANSLKNSIKGKKYRLWGGLVGVVVGLIVMFNTMMPIYGIMNIISSSNAVNLHNFSEDEISASSLSGGITSDILKGYELSAMGRVSKMLGIESLGLLTFDKVTTITTNNKEITLRKEVNALIDTIKEADDVLGEYKTVSNNGLENITQEQLDSLLLGVNNAIEKSEDVQIVNALSSYIIPIAVEYIVYNEIQLSDNAVINDILVKTLTTLANDHSVEIFNELKAIVGIADYLNEQKLLINIIRNDYSDILTVIDNLDEDFGDKLTTKIFSLQTINATAPLLLDLGLTIFEEMTSVDNIENDEITLDNIKNTMTNVINSTVDLAKSLSYSSPIYATDESLVPLGKLLESFKSSGLFNTSTYNKIVDYAVEQIKTFTINIIPDIFKNVFNNHLLRNVCDVTNWEDEMTVISNALTILRDNEFGILGNTKEGEELREGYSLNATLEEGTFINIGKALDKLEESTLLGGTASLDLNDETYNNTTIISLFTSIFKELNTYFASAESSLMQDLNDIITLMSDNLVMSEHVYDKTATDKSKFWENEMTAISPLILEIYNFTQSESIEVSDDLGTALDDSTQSVLLGGDTTLKLMNKVIGFVREQVVGEDYAPTSDDGTLNYQIYNLMIDIESNLLSTDLYDTMKLDENFWSKEITSIKALKNIADKASSITTIDDAQSIAVDLDTVYTSRIIPFTSMNSTIATVLKQLKSGATSGVEKSIDDLIDNITSDITSDTFWTDKSKEDFWQIELKHISNLTNIQFTNGDGYDVKSNLTSIGVELDKVVSGDNAENLRGSYLITEPRIRKLLATAITDIKGTISINAELNTTIQNVLTDICNNIYNEEDFNNKTLPEISSFSTELTHLQNLANISINSSLFVYNDTTDKDELIEKLRTLGSQLDTIAYNTTTTTENEGEENELTITSYATDSNSKIITRSMISSIVSACFDLAKVEVNEGETSLINTIISSIQESITTINSGDKVITWNRELSYVATLLELSANATYTLDNISTTVARHIDHIAFNGLDSNNDDENDKFADIEYNTNNQIIGKYDYSYEVDNNGSTDTKYYNSVIITRSLLQNAVNSILSDIELEETTDENKISNHLIANLESSINTTSIEFNDNLYNNYTDAFADLDSVKKTMESMAESIGNLAIEDMTSEIAQSIDNMLNDFQNKPISGVITTRKIALLIANKIDTSTIEITAVKEELDTYLGNLKTWYSTTNKTSTEREEYVTNNPTSDYANPFVTLYSKIPTA